ncbi:MAG: hypothetical protein ABI370_05955, partial [Gammaproteobacteria bacterium]
EMSLTADFTRYFRAIDSISKLPNRYGRPFILDTDLAVQLHKLADSLPLQPSADKKNFMHWVLNLLSRQTTKLNFANLKVYGVMKHLFNAIKPTELENDGILALIRYFTFLSTQYEPLINRIKINIWLLKLLTNELEFRLSPLDPAEKYLEMLLTSPEKNLTTAFVILRLQKYGYTYPTQKIINQTDARIALTDWVIIYLSQKIVQANPKPLSEQFLKVLLMKADWQTLAKWMHLQLLDSKTQSVTKLYELGLMQFLYNTVLKKQIPISLYDVHNDLISMFSLPLVSAPPVSNSSAAMMQNEVKTAAAPPPPLLSPLTKPKAYLISHNPSSFKYQSHNPHARTGTIAQLPSPQHDQEFSQETPYYGYKNH